MRFSAMPVANSIILAVVGQLLRKDALVNLPWWSFFLLPVAGPALCHCWAAAVSRGIQYQDYYMASARKIEKDQLMPMVLNDGQQIRWKGVGRVRTRNTMRIVVALFAILHLAGVVLILLKRSKPTFSF